MSGGRIDGMAALNRRLDAVASGRGRREILTRVALSAVAYSKEEAPVKTGNLRRTIHVASVSDTSATIAVSANYARFVHQGTRAHVIKPRRARILRWPNGAGARRLTGTARTGTRDFVFARVVHHPGTKANPFLVRGIKRAAADANLKAAVVKPWNEAA